VTGSQSSRHVLSAAYLDRPAVGVVDHAVAGPTTTTLNQQDQQQCQQQRRQQRRQNTGSSGAHVRAWRSADGEEVTPPPPRQTTQARPSVRPLVSALTQPTTDRAARRAPSDVHRSSATSAATATLSSTAGMTLQTGSTELNSLLNKQIDETQPHKCNELTNVFKSILLI